MFSQMKVPYFLYIDVNIKYISLSPMGTNLGGDIEYVKVCYLLDPKSDRRRTITNAHRMITPAIYSKPSRSIL